MDQANAEQFLQKIQRRRFQILFFSLIMISIAAPFMRDNSLGHLLFYVVLTFSLMSAVLAVSRRRRSGYIAGALLAVAFATSTWSTFFEDWLSSGWAAHTIADGAVFIAFTFTAALIFREVVSIGPVTTDKIFAAICVYLLAGIAWGLLYVLVYINNTDAFTFSFGELLSSDEPQETSQLFSVFCYFSFVTMTTLGYGDIIPTSEISRTLAWLQAVLGQLYVAVLVARLVGMHTQTLMQQDEQVESPPES